MFTKLRTPSGTRDFLPSEMVDQGYIEERFREVFRSWGYDEIRSPTIEFLDALTVGIGSELSDNMFKFQDFDGKIVALRSEMTAPVARIVASKMVSTPEPIRLSYITNVFRHSRSYVDRLREFWQAGVELIGLGTPDADAEVLALLFTSLEEVGLKDVRVDVSHAGLLKELLRAVSLDREKEHDLRALMGYRDWKQLEEFMRQNELPAELGEVFQGLGRARKLSEVSATFPLLSKFPDAQSFMKNLLAIHEILEDYGYADRLFFDFSLTRRIEYYTGIIFEASVPQVGSPIGGGGRYDDLIRKFGNIGVPATGFAIEVEKCLQALSAQGSSTPMSTGVRILVSSQSRNGALKALDAIRKVGAIGLLDLRCENKAKTMNYARLAGIDFIVFVSDSALREPVTILNVQSNRIETVELRDFLKSIGGTA